jgi:hypothetical protein
LVSYANVYLDDIIIQLKKPPISTPQILVSYTNSERGFTVYITESELLATLYTKLLGFTWNKRTCIQDLNVDLREKIKQDKEFFQSHFTRGYLVSAKLDNDVIQKYITVKCKKKKYKR